MDIEDIKEVYIVWQGTIDFITETGETISKFATVYDDDNMLTEDEEWYEIDHRKFIDDVDIDEVENK